MLGGFFYTKPMPFDFELQDFSDGWDDLTSADKKVSEDASADIENWDRPAPIDESWDDPLGLKSKTSGTVVEKQADGTSQSVTRKWLEDYMTDKPDQAERATPVATPESSEVSASDAILQESNRGAQATTNTRSNLAIPVMAMAAGAIGGKKSASSGAATAANAMAFAPPELNASWVDNFFNQKTEKHSAQLPENERKAFKLSQVYTDGNDRSTWKEDFGWDLGGNDAGSFIKRGAAAIGIEPPPSAYETKTTGQGDYEQAIAPSAYDQFRLSNPQATEAQAQAAVHGSLFSAAQQAGFDLSKYQVDAPAKTVQVQETGNSEFGGYRDATIPASTAIDVNRLYADLDDRFKDVYLVGGMAQGLPGQTGNTGQKAMQALYVRDGDKLVPTGTAKTYDAPENSQGFFGDMAGLTKDFAVDVMSDPVLATIVGVATAGASTAMATTIAAATGMGTTASTIAANALIGAGTSAVTGGDPLKGAITAGLAAGVSQLNPGAAIAPGAGEATQTAINRFAGTTVATGNPLAGLKTAGIGLATDAISPSIAKAVGDATGIDPKNAGAITGWVVKNAPALMQGQKLTPNQVMSLVSASAPKRNKA